MSKLYFALISLLFACFAMAAVNLNTATQAELEGLKGVGPVKAKAIIEYRQKNGGFKSVDELDNVTGFGKKTLDKLRADITVSGAAAPAAKPAGAPAGAAKPAAAAPAPAAKPAAPAVPAKK